MLRKIISLSKKTPFYFIFKRAKWANRLFDKNKYKQECLELHFYKSVLPSSIDKDIIFDVGANIGFKSMVFSQLAAHVVAFEPDQTNLHFLKGLFKNKRNITIVPLGLSSTAGIQQFYIQEDGSGFNTLNPKWKNILESPENRWKTSYMFTGKRAIETITLDDAIAKFGRPAYIKIDVEGHELEVVKGLTQWVPLLSIEANLPEFLQETKAAVSYLHRLNDRTVFNVTNSVDFMFNEFITCSEMLQFLDHTPLQYLEIYAKVNASLS